MLKTDKICLVLLGGLLGVQLGCHTGQVFETTQVSADRQRSENLVSDDEIRELFVSAGLGEGDGNLKKLLALPRELVVAVVLKLKDHGIGKGERGYRSENQSRRLKIKSAYFLWKLGVDRPANEKYIVEAAGSEDFQTKFEAISWLCPIVGESKTEYWPVILKAATEADGAYGHGLQGFLIEQIFSSPKTFLLYLSKEKLKVRRSVYKLVSLTQVMEERETFEQINDALIKSKADPETRSIAEEFLREFNKRR